MNEQDKVLRLFAVSVAQWALLASGWDDPASSRAVKVAEWLAHGIHPLAQCVRQAQWDAETAIVSAAWEDRLAEGGTPGGVLREDAAELAFFCLTLAPEEAAAHAEGYLRSLLPLEAASDALALLAEICGEAREIVPTLEEGRQS